jgi:hypothetical protein
MLKRGFLSGLNSTLLLLPPLKFHCVGGCLDRTQDYCDVYIGCQTLTPPNLIQTWPDLIHTQPDLIHTQPDLIHTQPDLIHTRSDLIHTRPHLISYHFYQMFHILKINLHKLI